MPSESEAHQFLVDRLGDLNVEASDYTVMGEAVEPAVLHDLIVAVQDQYGVTFDESTAAQVSSMTLSEFVQLIANGT